MKQPDKLSWITLTACLLTLLSAGVSAASAANNRGVIIFSTAPTQTPKATRKRYQPIADYLSRVLKRRVVLVPAENFIEYSQNIIEDKYDLVFDGPHFAAWRMKKYNHSLVAKLPGKLRFVVVIREDTHVKNLKRLAGKRVCAVGSPNLLTLGFIDLFPNPAAVPVIMNSKNFNAAIKCAKQHIGIAAVVRDKFWLKKPPKVKAGLKLFYTSKVTWPHRVFTTSARIDARTRQKIAEALLSDKARGPARLVLKQFKAKRFVRPTEAEYKGLGHLLRAIWGFHEQ